MLRKISVVVFMLAFAVFIPVRAQTDSAAEKQAAVKELVALINSANKAEEFVDAFSRQMDNTKSATVSSLLAERTDLTAAEKKALFDSLTQNQQEGSRRVREKLMQKLNYSEMINEIAATLYDKYYTLEEIRDLLAFYKTPTGQKSLKTMMPLVNDSMQMTQERVIPKISIILKEMETEDKLEIERQINESKPRPKQAATKQ